MGGAIGAWEKLIGDPAEEAEALELVLAELGRGSTLPAALSYAARAMEALAAAQGRSSPPARMSRLLESMAADATPSPKRPEPWRTLLATWQTFPANAAVAEHGIALVAKLRARRALRVELAVPWVYSLLLLALLLAGCLGLASWQVHSVPALGQSLGPGFVSLPPDWRAALEAPLLLLGVTVAVQLGLLWWSRDWLVPHVLGGTGPELLFFVGSGLAAGTPLPGVLRQAAKGHLCRRESDRRFLGGLADSLESGTPAKAPAAGELAHQTLSCAAALWRNQGLTAGALHFSALSLVARSGLRRKWMLPLTCTFALGTLVVMGLPVYVALLGGPTGGFWSTRIDTALRNVPPAAAAEAR